ncbi:MAG: NAD(P)H-hydrate dehydratase [Neisseria sp.]|nr:NAD(P)H-hydrate dehydratase [Neisseria sp.]
MPDYLLPENIRPRLIRESFPQLFAARPADSHKGTFGTLAVFGGAEGMSGAAVLAATAALYTGCGKVWAGFCQTALPMPVVPGRPEIMLATASRLIRRKDWDAAVAGCGMGADENARLLLAEILQTGNSRPLLLDADALNLLAQDTALARAAAGYPQLIITPHPAEAARLLHCRTADIQADRAAAAQNLAAAFCAITVLKGHRSLIALPGGGLTANTTGNAGLATAGSGDVLSGIIGSLLAQGVEGAQAAAGGVWLHGAAADVLSCSQTGPQGLLAGEIAPAARWLRNRIIENES